MLLVCLIGVACNFLLATPDCLINHEALVFPYSFEYSPCNTLKTLLKYEVFFNSLCGKAALNQADEDPEFKKTFTIYLQYSTYKGKIQKKAKKIKVSIFSKRRAFLSLPQKQVEKPIMPVLRYLFLWQDFKPWYLGEDSQFELSVFRILGYALERSLKIGKFRVEINSISSQPLDRPIPE